MTSRSTLNREADLAVIETMGIRYEILDDAYEAQLAVAVNYMQETGRPFALVVKKGRLTLIRFLRLDKPFRISREEALEAVIASVEPDAFLVSTTGKTSREIFEIRERRGKAMTGFFDGCQWGTLFHCAGMSLGSDKTIYCIDGDGSFLMHMGAAGIMAQYAKSNLKYILINNGAIRVCRRAADDLS